MAEGESAAYASAIFWACKDGTWCRLGVSSWTCLRPCARFSLRVTSGPEFEWRPWTQLMDNSAHPYVSWFEGAKTNVAFSTVDVSALTAYSNCGHDDCVSYEVVRASKDLQVRSRNLDCLTRSELLLAVLKCCGELNAMVSTTLTSLSRAFVHATTGLEQVVVCYAFARSAVCYHCTALDLTDESLEHRFGEFEPTLAVASSDALSGSTGETALRRCSRLFKASPCFKLTRGDARKWAKSLPSYVPPVAVGDACPLVVVFTSGSTGKPKGLVHGHGGYGSCVARSMSYVFGAQANRDIFLTLATFSWITGQSYMLYGPAFAQCTSILVEGSPLGADGLWWAHVARARGVTILKCASAFVRHAMGDCIRRKALEALDLPNSPLRLGTFCAEPVSVDVQQWASAHIVAPFINSYWATEHGSIILSRDPSGNFQPDTRCWPVPWVKASLKNANCDSLGDFVLDIPFSGLARTIFGSKENYGAPHWRGDLARFKAAYFPDGTCTFGFVQGDAALSINEAFTFHGRRDEVLNVLGVRVGVEELERVAWHTSNGAVRDIAIVGAPDTLKGQMPVGWVVLSNNNDASCRLLFKWRNALRETIGTHAEPNAILVVKEFPKTISGKTQRGLLQAALQGKKALHPSAAARTGCNIRVYANCYVAAQHWRLYKATSLAASLGDLASFWKNMCFDGHDVGGSPLLPAAGWLCILLQTLSPARPALRKVQFSRGIRDAKKSLILRKFSRTKGAVEDDAGQTIVKCEFHEPVLRPLSNLDHLQQRTFESSELLEDLDRNRHYRRCAAVALRYSGPFECVDRVCWHADWSFRVFVSPSSAPALLDAALQVVCSLDSLGRGATFVPFYVEHFEAVRDIEDSCPQYSIILGKVTVREDSYLQCDIAIYAATCSPMVYHQPNAKDLIATMRGIKFTKVDDARLRTASTSIVPSIHDQPVECNDGLLMRKITTLGSDLIGSEINPKQSLFENGLHSLRAVELISKINQAYNVNLSAVQFVAGENTLTAIATALRHEINAQNILRSSRSRFAHVNHLALQQIVNARLTGAEARGLRPGGQRSALAEAARGVIYMIRRGFFKYLGIQYFDGLFRFLIHTPTCINLDRTIVVPGRHVRFKQTDYNRHFTVREIIHDSERGFYNLIHASGLAHVEHYFRVMFYASRLEARFDAELLEGEAYEMRCNVANITGPLVDVEVAFYSTRIPHTRAFIITWRLMLVVDQQLKLMYDFERGGTFGSNNTTIQIDNKSSNKKTYIAPLKKRSETWTLTRRGEFMTSGSIAFFGILVGLYAMAPVAIRILVPLPLVVTDVLKDLKPREAFIIFALIGFWFGTHPGQKPLDGPVDMLLPHG